MVKILLTVLSLAASSFATVFVTQPISSTTCTGGQTCEIAWSDNGQAPTLAQFGPAEVSIYTGNAQQQTQLQLITSSVDVSTTQAIQFTVNPSIGPDGDVYFIRFQSLSAMDPTTPTEPALAFSAKFSLAGMSGTFNASVQAEIAGTSTAPIGGGPAPATPPAATGTGSRLTTASSAKPTGSSTTKPTSSGATGKGSVSVVVGLAGVLVGVLIVL